MRKEFMAAENYALKTGEKLTLALAKSAMPWAAVVVRAAGGFWGFASLSEYQQWRNQR